MQLVAPPLPVPAGGIAPSAACCPARVHQTHRAIFSCTWLRPAPCPQVHVDDQQEQLYLLPNLGFIKLALRHAVPIIPSYAFGENQLFPTIPGAPLLEFRRWLARKLRIGLPAVWPTLRSGVEHTYVLGRPVFTASTPVEHPTEAQVAEVLERWVAEVQRLFHEHAPAALSAAVAARGLKISRRSEKESKASAAGMGTSIELPEAGGTVSLERSCSPPVLDLPLDGQQRVERRLRMHSRL